MSSPTSVLNHLEVLLKQARQRSHRLLVVLSGSQAWCQTQMTGFAESTLADHDVANRWLWIGDAVSGLTPPTSVKSVAAKQAHQWLGQERDGIVFDCWSGFNPNGFGQVVGTLVAGGLFILITPSLAQWQRFNDPEYQQLAVPPFSVDDVGRRFIRHLQNTIAAASELLHFDEAMSTAELAEVIAHDALDRSVNSVKRTPIEADQSVSCMLHDTLQSPFKTQDQQHAVLKCLPIMSQSRAVTVITADRGRGKSAALGILTARLMQPYAQTMGHPPLEIIITAPSRGAIQVAVGLLENQLSSLSSRERDSWRVGASRLRFMLPDQLVQQRPVADLLLVDEAAAIPAPVLLNLLDYPRVIFASTVHGYEGTGQGFAVRFMPYLDRLVPQRQLLRLQQPVRWAAGDPLERFSYQALLLDAEPAHLASQPVKGLAYCFRPLDRDALLRDSRLLKQLFGLLILAHYRTTPGDLRILLDSPNIEIWAGFSEQAGEQTLVAAALLAYEGPIDAPLASAIMHGTRRPKGQLIPQTLLAHCQLPAAANCRGLRVMRIAVHPQRQRLGIGTQLLTAIEQGCTDIDWLGASFGATPVLCHFWQQFGLQLQRLGHHRDKVSGTQAAVMLRGISAAGIALQQQGAAKAREQLQRLSAVDAALIDADLLTVLTTESHSPSSCAGEAS
ncbi:GNAT family N-acetyltransferase [Amphritea sp. 1_MG-2023]|uniref:tRNA(Met) cytidine acetyltransferase TmcA n=1 Tax=Amphritea sp. 1_MG-2023 TaxID=3062670 RepID=UPI0026E13ACD|nr:GNAT family N-acetyltransferase [Amphritea sp. 1_MG-2023]MDO6562188.1 GNAT family N-acetyltransferase [Amphritea sp. 1_MG-2023]